MSLEFQRLHPDAVLPARAHPGDAGLDVVSVEDHTIEPGERALIATGFAVAVPDGHAGLLLPRSGLAVKHGLTLANSPGLIDAGYRGEVKVALVNLDRTQAVTIKVGDRIAQLVVIEVPPTNPAWVDRLTETARGQGGFGSSGTASA